MSADVSDLSLVRRVQRGDKGAFDALVLKYQHKLVKLVMRYVRNPAEAEDIAQEAFIKAYRALPQFRGDSAFYTWLYRIAINTAKNAVVSRDRSPIDYDLDRNSHDESYEMQGRMKDAETPEGLVLTDEIRSTVNAAIDALPEDLRTAIVLRELEGLSYEEIAAAMDCPVGTVRSQNLPGPRGDRPAPAGSIRRWPGPRRGIGMNEELDSQLSAMFDDELPPPECELLARRLSRDELLKARWGRYAVVGAVIRAERGVRLNAPLAGRVNAALSAEPALRRARGTEPRAAGARCAGGNRSPAGAVAAGVAALSVLWLRAQAPLAVTPLAAQRLPAALSAAPGAVAQGRRRRRRELRHAARAAGAPDAGAEHAAGELRGRPQHVFLPGDAAQPALLVHHQRAGRRRTLEAPPGRCPEQCAVASESWRWRSAVSPRGSVLAEEPARWLERMNQALTTRNYDGTFSHWHGGQVEMLRIIHRVQDGTVSERLASLDGSGREFIRTGASLACYLPDKRTVVVEQRPQQESAGRLPGGQRPDRELLRHQGSGAHAPEPPRHPRDHGHPQGRVPLRLPAVDR